MVWRSELLLKGKVTGCFTAAIYFDTFDTEPINLYILSVLPLKRLLAYFTYARVGLIQLEKRLVMYNVMH